MKLSTLLLCAVAASCAAPEPEEVEYESVHHYLAAQEGITIEQYDARLKEQHERDAKQIISTSIVGYNSHVTIWRDPDTGCDYLISEKSSVGYGARAAATSITPRTGPDGKQICGAPAND